MENGEIKSFIVDVPLSKLTSIEPYIKTKTTYIGLLQIYEPIVKLECIKVIHGVCINTKVKCMLLGYIARESSKDIQEVIIQFLDNFNITRCNIDDIYVSKEIVLKEQISNLKYIEQLELFKDDEGKD